MSADHTSTPIVIGAGSRVGRGVTAFWRRMGQDHAAFSRADWDMITEVPPNCPEAVGQTVFVLARVAPGHRGEMADNIKLACAAIDAARSWGARHVFVASSQAVYGSTSLEGADEMARTNAQGTYAETKLEIERVTAGRGVTALRLANVAGMSEPFVTIARDPGPLTFDRFDDGSGPVRSFIGIEQLGRVLAGLADQVRRGADIPPLLNVAAPGPVAMADIAQAAGRDVLWRRARDGATKQVCLDCTRLAQLVDLHEESAETLWADSVRYAK